MDSNIHSIPHVYLDTYVSHCKNCKERVNNGTFPHSDAHFEGYVILSDTPKVSITSILCKRQVSNASFSNLLMSSS